MKLVKRIKGGPSPTCLICLGTGFAGGGLTAYGDQIVGNLDDYTCSCCVEYVPASSPEPKSDELNSPTSTGQDGDSQTGH